MSTSTRGRARSVASPALGKLLAMFMLALAKLMSLRRGFARLNHWIGEEFLKTIEAADGDLPKPVGMATRRKANQMNSRGQLGLGTILAAFTIVIAAFLVLIVVDSFNSSLGDPSSSQLSSSQSSILSGFASMMDLIGPLLLVAIVVVIIGLIRRIQG